MSFSRGVRGPRGIRRGASLTRRALTILLPIAIAGLAGLRLAASPTGHRAGPAPPSPPGAVASSAPVPGAATASGSAAPRARALEGVDAAALPAFLAGRQRLIERLAARAGIDAARLAPPSYQLFASLVQKGERTGSSAPVDLPQGGGVIRRVLDLPCSARDGEAEAAWLMYSAWGVKPLAVWSAGLAAVDAGTLYGRPAGALAGALARSGLLPALDELLAAPRSVRQYPTLFAPAAGILAGWVLERRGPDAFRRAVMATAAPSANAPALAAALGMEEGDLRRAYARALVEKAARGPRAPEREPGGAPAGRQRGVCYAHTVSLERGYASPRSARTLDQLAELGVNWVSVTPFGYLELHDPEISASSGFGPEGETDESLAAVIGQAHARGMGVLLKPHLWSTDWVGRISMPGEPAWQRFFLEYGRYIAHQAVLGEACGAAALCVGNELVEATRGHDPQWRALISAARSVFSGPLTYGAHWDQEVERIGFWDALDWVGVSLYAPLAARPGAAVSDLESAARRQAQRLGGIARRAGRPLVIVEVGFPSHARAALAPWEDPEDGPPDPAAQAEAFEAVLKAFWKQPFVAGIYWWKWFSDDHPSPGDRSHRFDGKPAAEVVRRFYRGR